MLAGSLLFLLFFQDDAWWREPRDFKPPSGVQTRSSEQQEGGAASNDRVTYLEYRVTRLENANLPVDVAVMRSQLDSIIKMLWVLFGAAVANVVQLLWQFSALIARKRNENGPSQVILPNK